jgi:polygalacturonase
MEFLAATPQVTKTNAGRSNNQSADGTSCSNTRSSSADSKNTDSHYTNGTSCCATPSVTKTDFNRSNHQPTDGIHCSNPRISNVTVPIRPYSCNTDGINFGQLQYQLFHHNRFDHSYADTEFTNADNRLLLQPGTTDRCSGD